MEYKPHPKALRAGSASWRSTVWLSHGHHRRLGSVLALVILVGACSPAAEPSDASPADTAPGVSDTTTPATLPEPDPVAVTVTLDLAASTTGFIGPEGGTLTVRDAAGVAYTLTVPAYAFPRGEDVTMTGVAAIEGFPVDGGYLAAVHLEPSGLRLWQPATLTFTVLDLPPEVYAFGYDRDGDDFHLAPTLPGETTAAVIPVTHFSGVGVGSGNPGSVGNNLGSTPASGANQLAQALGKLDPRSTGFERQATEVMQAHYHVHVRPLLERATDSGDLADFEAAFTAYYHWWLHVEMGFGSGELLAAMVEDGWDLLGAAAHAVVDEAYRRCAEEHDFGVTDTILHIGYLSELGLVPDDVPGLAEAHDRIRACLRFELHLESTLLMTSTGPSFEVRGSAMLTMLEDLLWVWQGSGTTEILEYEGLNVAPCTMTAATTPDTLEVEFMSFSLESRAGEPPEVRNVRVTLSPGYPTDQETISCPGAPAQTGPVLTTWGVTFVVLHGEELDAERGMFIVEGWTIPLGSTEILAEKAYLNTLATVTERTVLTIVHRPAD